MSTISASAPAHPHLLVRWFVQYNPLFTASALCVLGGVFLLARALGDEASLALTSILELYQWLLIGTAALLYRRLLERRPAVILGIIQLVLMADPTLQLSALASAGQHVGAAVWVLSFAAKLHVLAWAFRLQTSRTARWLPIAGAVIVAAIPSIRVTGLVELPFVLAAVVFVLGFIATAHPPSVTSRLALSEHGLTMFPRIVRAAVFIGACGFAFQAANVALASGLHTLLPAVGAVAFVLVARARGDAAWAWAIIGCALSAVGSGQPFAGAPLAFVALLLAARHSPPRILVAAVVCGWVALVTSAGLAAPHELMVHAALATVPLAFVLFRRRGWSALPVLAFVHIAWTRAAGHDLQPHGVGQWGALLVVAGFLLLPAGLLAHRRLSQILDAAAPPDVPDAPTTSAALPLRL